MTAPEKKSIYFVSLGCSKNRVDTEVMLGVSDGAGYSLVRDPAQANVIVVNTCGFVEAAKKESIETIFELADYKQSGQCETLVVAGCLSQRYSAELAEGMGEVDHFLGSSDMLKLGEVLRADAGHKAARMLVGNPAEYIYRQSDPRRLSGATHSAYVKIAEGCSRKCSFCAIPSFRGTQRSRPIADIVAEVERLCSQGTVEINLISQDTIQYGRDLPGDVDLPALLRALLEVRDLRWLRLFYLYPQRMDEPLLELLEAGGKLVPYVDVPFQHVTDRMLKIMRRGYTAARQRAFIDQLRTRVPGLFMRSAFIVGHPGETEADFQALLEFLPSAELDHVGFFRYSHEEGTHSFSIEEKVAPKLIEKRVGQLMRAQRSVSRKRLKTLIGRELAVLVEGESDESELLLVGRHAGQAPEVDGRVQLINGTARPGEIHRVRITQAADYDLVGDLSLGEADPQQPPAAAKPARKAPQNRRLRVV